MKKHNKDLFYAEANQRQRFSIRKLTIGAASVLLSTAFYLGTNANVSHAETATQSSADAQTESVVSNDQSDSDKSVAENNKDTNKTPNQAATTETNNNLTNNQAKDNSQKAAEPNKDQKKDTETQAFSPAAHNKPMSKEAAEQSEAKSDSSTTFSYLVNGENKDTTTVSTGNSVILNFNSNEYGTGDKFTFKIKPSTDGIDLKGTYGITPSDQKAKVSKVIYNDVDKAYEFTDEMTSSGTYNQKISIDTKDQFNPKEIQKDGTYEIKVDVYKNGTFFKGTSFKQTVSHNQSVGWYVGDGINNIYTMDSEHVSTGIISPNKDYTWKLNFWHNPVFNHGTTINIPVPEHFELNSDEVQKQNADWIKKYNATVTQTENNVVVTLPQLTNEQLTALNLSSSSYGQQSTFSIIGKIAEQPKETTLYAGANDIKMTYDYGNGKKTASTSILSAKVLGKNDSVDKAPIGELLTVHLAPDQYNKMHQYYADQPYEITTKEDSDKGIHALNNSVRLSSTTAHTLTNVDATIIVPDGMNISSIQTASTSDQKPTYKYVYLDGTKSDTFTQDNILTAPTGKYIKKILVHCDTVDPYHQMFDVNLMGVLADNYRGDNDDSTKKASDNNQASSGDELQDRDVLKTKVDVALADSATNENHQAQEWTGSQQVLIKNPDTTIYRTQVEYNGGQKDSKKQAGDKEAGTMGISPRNFEPKKPDITYILFYQRMLF